jgi:hypothetical protein
LGGLLRDPAAFCAACGGIRLRAYQAEVMQAVADSVIHKRG